VVEGVEIPNDYTAGLRQFMNLMTRKLTGLKSYDYHIIMERLMHVMFQGCLDDAVWMVLADDQGNYFLWTTMC
jgi:hypothetical protein